MLDNLQEEKRIGSQGPLAHITSTNGNQLNPRLTMGNRDKRKEGGKKLTSQRVKL